MKKNVNPRNAWKIVLEEARRQLLEADEESDDKDEKEPEEGEDSLDDQIDRYLADFEKEAKSAKKEGKDWRSTIKRLLGEADDDEEDAGEDEEEGGDEEGGDDEGMDFDDPASVKPPKLKSNDIDMGSYVNSVVRLINNYDNLLEVRNTILRRAANFISKMYDEQAVLSYNEELSSSHGIEIGKSKEENEYEKFPPPAADRAGGSGSSGGP